MMRSITMALALACSATASCQQRSHASQAESPSEAQQTTLIHQIMRGDASVCTDPTVIEMVGREGIDTPFYGYKWADENETKFWSVYTDRVKKITFENFQHDAKKLTCAGFYSASIPGWSNSTRVEYEVQATLEGKYVVRITNMPDLQDVVMALKTIYWRENIMGPAEEARQRSVQARIERDREAWEQHEAQRRAAGDERDKAVQADAERRKVVSRVEFGGPPPTLAGPPAPPSPARPQVVSNPSWTRSPQAQMPERALSQGVQSGNVTLSCSVQQNGSLSRCTVMSETPSGVGFGRAAMQSAADARVAPRTVDSVAEGGSVRFNITFRADQQ